jgi:small subunit ribosomal protein S1
MEDTTENYTQSAGNSGHPMDFLLAESIEVGIPEAGDVRSGIVVECLPNAVLVDIGAKSEGIISADELSTLSSSNLARLQPGVEIQVYVVDPEDSNGNLVLSFARAQEMNDWQLATQLQESREIYEGEIVGFNKGGLLVELGTLRGFVPISQLGPDRRISRKAPAADQLRSFVGQPMMARVIEVDRKRNRLILSERAASREIREVQRAAFLEDLQEGDIREGKVVNLTDFGAFVDIGGIEGLVHLSELSWKRVSNPSEVVALGDTVQVYVLNVDEERQRVALSIKRLETDPWSILDELYTVGQLAEASVTKLTKFGAFARLQDDYELEGLIHISELSEEHVQHPRDVVSYGDLVAVRIIRVDAEQRQLGLSLKQVASERFMDADLAAISDVDYDTEDDDDDGEGSDW